MTPALFALFACADRMSTADTAAVVVCALAGMGLLVFIVWVGIR